MLFPIWQRVITGSRPAPSGMKGKDQMARTDNTAEVGMHVFERAGLGIAPFRCIGMVEETYQACQGAPVQPGGCCDYCSNGIRYCYQIRDRNGKTFKVGSDCVARTGDAGLIKSFKNRPEVRAMNRAKAQMRDERTKAAWAALLSDETAKAKLSTFTVSNWKGENETWLAFATRAWGYCGAAGRARYLKAAKKLLETPTKCLAA